METAPTLSVLMPTYDEAERLRAALRSLSEQDYPTDRVQIVVVDDASPTPVDEGDLRQALDPFALTLVRHESNQGRARARNTGLRHATGDIVIFLDSDMTVERDFLRSHAEAHADGGEQVLIGNIVWGRDIPPSALTRYVEKRGVHRTGEQGQVHFKCFVTGNSSLPRTLLERVGPFDEDFTVYGGEDLELGYRLYHAGAQFGYVERALSYHNHIRPLDQLCRLMCTYGRGSIPILVEKHPELVGVLRLSFLRAPLLSPKRLALQWALLPTTYWPLYWLANALVGWRLPDLIFDYLFWYNRTRGYIDSRPVAK